MRSVKASISFLDEDMTDIDLEDIKQPCQYNNECNQETYGWHKFECNKAYYDKTGRYNGESWEDMVVRQGKFDPGHSKFAAEDKTGHYYDEDLEHSSPEEEEN